MGLLVLLLLVARFWCRVCEKKAQPACHNSPINLNNMQPLTCTTRCEAIHPKKLSKEAEQKNLASHSRVNWKLMFNRVRAEFSTEPRRQKYT